MKTIKHIIILSMMIALCFSLCMIPAQAAVISFTDEDIEDIGTEVTTSSVESFISSNTSSAWFSVYLTTDANSANSENDTYTVDGTTYYVKKGQTADGFKNKVLNEFKASLTTQQTAEITDSIDVSADTSGATQALSGLVPYINIFLGAVVTLITIGLAVFTAFDVCYIVFPVFRNKCEQQKMSGQGPMVTQSANGGTKLRWVSDEAQYAASHASLEQGSNPLMNYLKNRVIAYVFVAIILFILLTGNISIITNLALKAVSGIMNVLGSLS